MMKYLPQRLNQSQKINRSNLRIVYKKIFTNETSYNTSFILIKNLINILKITLFSQFLQNFRLTFSFS